jgi:hypothetical protein
LLEIGTHEDETILIEAGTGIWKLRLFHHHQDRTDTAVDEIV